MVIDNSLDFHTFILWFVEGEALGEPRQVSLPPDIYPGVVGEEMRKQAITQRAMYRRLFMDMEREQVKETKRRKAHRQRIAR